MCGRASTAAYGAAWVLAVSVPMELFVTAPGACPGPASAFVSLDRRNCLGRAGSPDLSLSSYRTLPERLLAAELPCTRSQKCFKEGSFCARFCEVLKITTKVNLGVYRPPEHSALL